MRGTAHPQLGVTQAHDSRRLPALLPGALHPAPQVRPRELPEHARVWARWPTRANCPAPLTRPRPHPLPCFATQTLQHPCSSRRVFLHLRDSAGADRQAPMSRGAQHAAQEQEARQARRGRLTNFAETETNSAEQCVGIDYWRRAQHHAEALSCRTGNGVGGEEDVEIRPQEPIVTMRQAPDDTPLSWRDSAEAGSPRGGSSTAGTVAARERRMAGP